MNTSRFFTAYAIRRLLKQGRPITTSTVSAKRTELMKVGVCHVVAQEAGNEKRLAAHRNACLTAYRAKVSMCNDLQGHNSTEGLPA